MLNPSLQRPPSVGSQLGKRILVDKSLEVPSSHKGKRRNLSLVWTEQLFSARLQLELHPMFTIIKILANLFS
jgi:hypothetical protein